MGKLRKITAWPIALLLIFCLNLGVFAEGLDDLNRTGTITVTMRMGETAVGGGTLTMFWVGEIQEKNGTYSFQPTEEFKASQKTFEEVESPTLAKDLTDYIVNQKLTGVTKEISEEGIVTFSDLKLGLYLFVQNEAAADYNKADSFLVSLPYRGEDGAYTYQVDASPKVSLKQSPQPGSPSAPGNPSSSLPQTGQLNWPIPILAVSGLVLFAVGWILCFGKRKPQADRVPE